MEPSNRKPSDEIDLMYFFNPVFRGIAAAQTGLGRYFRLLRRNFLLFLGLFIVLVLIGYSIRFVVPQYFKVHTMMISHSLPADFCSILINDLDKLADNPANRPVLAEQLKVPVEVAGAIVSISTIPLDSAVYVDKRDSAASMFKIDMVVRNTEGVSQIQDGLQRFLENNEFALKRKEARRRTLDLLKQNLVQKSNSLDSLKDIVNSSITPRSSGQGIIFGEPVSPIEVYELQVDYYRQLLEIEEDLSMIDNIEVIQPFLGSNATNYPDFGRLLLYSILAGLIIALIMTPLLAPRRK